jgi:hypothetical protein
MRKKRDDMGTRSGFFFYRFIYKRENLWGYRMFLWLHFGMWTRQRRM